MEKKWFPYAAIAAVVAAMYYRALSFGFTWLDDDTLIIDSLPFLSRLSNIPAAFTHGIFTGIYYYRPLLTLSLMLDASVGGASPFFYHLDNILLHAAAAMCLYYFLRLLGRTVQFSLAAALIFSVHPVAGQAVAWIPGRNDILLCVFSLLSFSSFIKWLAGSGGYFLRHLFFYFCALLTKENAAVLPLLMAFYAYYAAPTQQRPRRLAIAAAAWAAVTAVWLLCRFSVFGVLAISEQPAGALFAHTLPAVFSYIGRVFFPYGLSVMPALKDMSLGPGVVAAVLAAVFILSSCADKKRSVFAAVWFLAFLLPTLARGDAGGLPRDYADHRVYTSMAGLFIAAGGMRFPEAFKLAAGAVLFILLAGLSLIRLPVFSGRLSFWENAVQYSPSNPVSRTQLGAAYFEAGRCREAAAQFSAAWEMAPGDAVINLDMGNVAQACGDPDRALFYWEKALAAEPGNIAALNNVAVFYYTKKDLKKAALYVTRLVAAGAPVHPDLLSAAARYRQGVPAASRAEQARWPDLEAEQGQKRPRTNRGAQKEEP